MLADIAAHRLRFWYCFIYDSWDIHTVLIMSWAGASPVIWWIVMWWLQIANTREWLTSMTRYRDISHFLPRKQYQIDYATSAAVPRLPHASRRRYLARFNMATAVDTPRASYTTADIARTRSGDAHHRPAPPGARSRASLFNCWLAAAKLGLIDYWARMSILVGDLLWQLLQCFMAMTKSIWGAIYDIARRESCRNTAWPRHYLPHYYRYHQVAQIPATTVIIWGLRNAIIAFYSAPYKRRRKILLTDRERCCRVSRDVYFEGLFDLMPRESSKRR